MRGANLPISGTIREAFRVAELLGVCDQALYDLLLKYTVAKVCLGLYVQRLDTSFPVLITIAERDCRQFLAQGGPVVGIRLRVNYRQARVQRFQFSQFAAEDFYRLEMLRG